MIARRPIDAGAADRQAPIELSAMQREDLAMVLEVERRSFSHPWSAQFFLQEMRLSFSKIVVARALDLGVVVGYVCRWITAGELHILNVAVHPEWRRRSIGRRLLEEVLDEGGRAGVTSANLEVRQYNVPALSLYERLGFRKVGIRRNYYGPGEDALAMTLSFHRGG